MAEDLIAAGLPVRWILLIQTASSAGLNTLKVSWVRRPATTRASETAMAYGLSDGDQSSAAVVITLAL